MATEQGHRLLHDALELWVTEIISIPLAKNYFMYTIGRCAIGEKNKSYYLKREK